MKRVYGAMALLLMAWMLSRPMGALAGALPLGNTPQNLAHGGLAAAGEEAVYFQGQDGLWCIGVDGEGLRKLRDGDAWCLNLSGDRLYFIAEEPGVAGAVHQMDIATGRSAPLIEGSVDFFVTAGEYGYYRPFGADQPVFRGPLGGGEDRQATPGPCDSFSIWEDVLFTGYFAERKFEVAAYSLPDMGEIAALQAPGMLDYVGLDGYLYLAVGVEDAPLRIRPDGRDREQLDGLWGKGFEDGYYYRIEGEARIDFPGRGSVPVGDVVRRDPVSGRDEVVLRGAFAEVRAVIGDLLVATEYIERTDDLRTLVYYGPTGVWHALPDARKR